MQLPLPLAGQPLQIPVENRYAFSDLNECRFEWSQGAHKGVAKISAPPGTKGTLALPSGRSPGVLELKAYNIEGLMVDAWRIRIGESPTTAQLAASSHKVELLRGVERHTIRCGDRAWEVDARNGQLLGASIHGRRLQLSGPELLILPLDISPIRIFVQDGKAPANYMSESWREQRFAQWGRNPKPDTGVCSGWRPTSVQAEERDGVVEVKVEGRYQEAEGRFLLRFAGDGGVQSLYDFKLTEVLMPEPKGQKPLKPRQLGLVFTLPATCDELSWRRKAQWTYYPGDQIGRPEGRARAFPGTPLCPDLVYRQAPTWPWSQDTTPQGSWA